MATLTELVSALAESLGVPERTLSVCARYVREAGLISQKGRGPSAAKMAPADAANLLLGIMSANELQESAACAQRAREFVCYGFERNFEGDVIEIKDSPYQNFTGGGARLGTVIEKLIDYAARNGDLRGDRDQIITNLSLEIDRPGLNADMQFDDGSDVWVAKFGVPNTPKARAAFLKLIPPYRAMHVSARTDMIQAIDAIAVALLGRQPEEGELVIPPWAPEAERRKAENRNLRKSQRDKRPKR